MTIKEYLLPLGLWLMATSYFTSSLLVLRDGERDAEKMTAGMEELSEWSCRIWLGRTSLISWPLLWKISVWYSKKEDPSNKTFLFIIITEEEIHETKGVKSSQCCVTCLVWCHSSIEVKAWLGLVQTLRELCCHGCNNKHVDKVREKSRLCFKTNNDNYQTEVQRLKVRGFVDLPWVDCR